MSAVDRDPRGDRGGGEGSRWWIVALTPLVVMGLFVAWLFSSGALDALRGAHGAKLREERALLAMDATPPGDRAALVEALQTEPSQWTPDTRRAVAGLLARTDWAPSDPEGSGRLLADRDPSTWDGEQRARVRHLLQTYRLHQAPLEAPRAPAW